MSRREVLLITLLAVIGIFMFATGIVMMESSQQGESMFHWGVFVTVIGGGLAVVCGSAVTDLCESSRNKPG
jgi:hypothetical protein